MRLLTLLMLWFMPTLVAQTSVGRAPAVAPTIDPAIVARANAYQNAMTSGDVAGLGSLYRDDAVEMRPCQPALRGRAAIEQNYRELLGGPVKVTAFAFEHREARASGDVAFDVGTFRMHLTGTPAGDIDDSGSYVVILKRSGSEWQVAYLIYNGDHPAPGC